MEATHKSPIWRSKANFIIGTELDRQEGIESEQLWANKQEDGLYEVCCIPFFAYDIALGDVVEVDNRFNVVRVVRPSGRFVFRVFLSPDTPTSHAIVDEVAGLGVLVEWFSPHLFAIDCKDEASAVTIADLLQADEDKGLLNYETGRS